MAPANKQQMKSRPPKMTTQTLLDFDLGESSSDSDFRIEDHAESDDDDFSGNSNEDDSNLEDEDESDSEDEKSSDSVNEFVESSNRLSNLSPKKSPKHIISIKDVLEKVSAPILNEKIPTKPICCACLGDRSDDTNEIVECDGCGVSVHEGCYGVSDSNSVSSTVSSCSTEPWFCEACRAGVMNPSCELCPNKGGIFKETDVGKWVHLVCALYVPGVAFGEVDQLSSVTLFEMPYSKWGAKTCSLCEDEKFARTGVCIGCDAGMCKTYFHVTCAQAAGFLSEAHSEEADHADPFYAHCKIHSDKTMIKHRRKNYNVLKVKMEQRKLNKIEAQYEKPSTEQLRIQRKLMKYQTKYKTNKLQKNEPWVPTQKMSRLLNTSATTCRRLMLKTELMGIDTAALEFQEAQMAMLSDVRRKWHIPPAFSVEFIGYYIDRISRLKDLKSSLEKHLQMNEKLLEDQKNLREEYDQKSKRNEELTAKNTKLTDAVNTLHIQISALCPDKTFPSIDNIGRQVMVPSPAPPPSRPMSVPTAAALKMGVGFPLINLSGGTKDDTGRILSTQSRQNNDELVHECGICKRCNDQHLLAKCDTCHFYYHLGCLNPPLTRHPKKSKLYGWQCSECDKSDDSDVLVEFPSGPRKSRTRFSKDGTIVPCDQSNTSSSNTESHSSLNNKSIESNQSTLLPKHSKSVENKFQNQDEQNSKNNDNDLDNTNKEKLQKNEINHINLTKSVNVKCKNMVKSKQMKKLDNEIRKLVEQCEETHTFLSKSIRNNSSSSSKNVASTAKKDGVKKAFENKVKTNVSDEKTFQKLQNQDDNEKWKKCSESEKNSEDNSAVKYNSIKNEIEDVENLNTNVDKIKTEDVVDNAAQKEKTVCNLDGLAPQNNDESIINQQLESKSDIKKDLENNLSIQQLNKQNRKKRKEKHKNKYGSDHEKSPGKEHKRKRKKKSHDRENSTSASTSINNDIPKIKIKLKPLPLPGEAAPEPQFFYVSADMVRDNSRPTSVETIDESTSNMNDLYLNNSPVFSSGMTSTPIPTSSTPRSNRSPPTKCNNVRSQSQAQSPIKSPSRAVTSRRTLKRSSSVTNSTQNSKQSSTDKLCDACTQTGNNQNLVQCDECNKNYHFTCLDPPLKKTPKRRGYSWHCADCDPTDHESS